MQGGWITRLGRCLLGLAAVSGALEPVRNDRPVVAVFSFTPMGVDSAQTLVLSETLSYELMKTGRVRVMERSQMQAILAEQGFQKSGACDATECAVQVGRILGVERVVLGSVGLVGSTYALNLRQVSVGTGEILTVSSRKVTGAMEKLLEQSIPKAAEDLFPPVSIPVQRPAATESGTPARQGEEPTYFPYQKLIPDHLQFGIEGMLIHTGEVGYSGFPLAGHVRAWWDTPSRNWAFGLGAMYADNLGYDYGWGNSSSGYCSGMSITGKRYIDLTRFQPGLTGNFGLDASMVWVGYRGFGYMYSQQEWLLLPQAFAGLSTRFDSNLSMDATYGFGTFGEDFVHRLELSIRLHLR